MRRNTKYSAPTMEEVGGSVSRGGRPRRRWAAVSRPLAENVNKAVRITVARRSIISGELILALVPVALILQLAVSPVLGISSSSGTTASSESHLHHAKSSSSSSSALSGSTSSLVISPEGRAAAEKDLAVSLASSSSDRITSRGHDMAASRPTSFVDLDLLQPNPYAR